MSKATLWQRYKQYKRITTQDYFFDGSGKTPRYYQTNAINRTVEAIAKGQNRISLTMATGTGKTYTAFQIIHRLWKGKTKKRIIMSTNCPKVTKPTPKPSPFNEPNLTV